MNKEILLALANIGVPVAFQAYGGTETTYITFFNMLENGESYADDKETSLGYYIQVDVWSKGNYSTLVDSVIEALKQAGFSKNNARDLYEIDTKIYHKAIRIFKLKEEL